jgi:hypothetical protein
MTTIGESTEKPAGKSRRRDRVIAVVGTVVVLIVVWLTEIPQERIADWGLERTFGTGVQIEYGSTFGALHIDSLTLFSTINEQGLPVVQISDLTIDYDLFPKDGRWIREVVIGSINARLDATDAANPNFAFILSFLAEDDSDPPPKSVIPHTVRIDEIAVSVAGTPPGDIDGQPFPPLGLNIAGLNALIELDGERVTHATISGQDITTYTWARDNTDVTQHSGGRIQIAFDGDATTSRIDTMMVDLPNLLEVRGTASSDQMASVRNDRAEIRVLKIDGAGFAADAMPIAFGQIDASGITIDTTAWKIPCAIAGLRIGVPERLLYDGNVQIDVDRQTDSNVELRVTLNEGQQIDANFDPDNGSAIASVEAWTPDMLETAIPPVFRDRLTDIPDFHEFSLTVAASAPKANDWIQDPSHDPLPFNFSVFGGTTLVQQAEEGAIEIEAAGNGAWSEDGLASATAKGEIVIAGERAEFGVERGVDTSLAATATLNDVQISRWLKLALGDLPLGVASGTLNGTLTHDGTTGSGDLILSRGEDRAVLSTRITGAIDTPDDPLRFVAEIESGGTANLTYEASGDTWSGGIEFAAFDIGRLARLVAFESDIVGTATGNASISRGPDTAYGQATARLENIRSDDWSLNPEAPIEMALAFEADPDLQTVQGGPAKITIGGETIVFTERWEWTQEPWQLKTIATANFDLERHGKAVGVEGWSGQAQATLTVDHQQDHWQAPVQVVWTDPRIAGLEDLYAGPITFDGTLSREPNASATTLTNGNVAWGEHTQVTIPRAAIETSPFGVIGGVNIETDLTVLVAMDLLRYIDGGMNAEGEVRLIDGNPQFELAMDANISALELPDGMAAAHTAHLAGSISYNGEFGGAGTFNANSATSAGALITEIGGGYTFSDDLLSLSDVVGQVYGGQVLGHGEVELLTGTYNGEFMADISRLDLDRFTKEFEPGEFRLTGISNGDVYARWSTVGLSGATFDLNSTEGFTLDRETVETMLTAVALPDHWGMRWIKRRINKKMIGDDPQRPFDSARVDLELRQTDGEPDRLLGPITLNSETLDFNIDWAIDVKAIYAAMESDLAAVENFSAGTVQSEDQ